MTIWDDGDEEREPSAGSRVPYDASGDLHYPEPADELAWWWRACLVSAPYLLGAVGAIVLAEMIARQVLR